MCDYISDHEVVKRAQAAVRMELEKKRVLNQDAYVYDSETKMICKITSDGQRIPVAKRLREGRYSERNK